MLCHAAEQGSYPFSPFAMPSPNGILEVSISSLIYFCCLVVLEVFFPFMSACEEL